VHRKRKVGRGSDYGAAPSRELIARFSTVAGELGAADHERDERGFAAKSYAEEGNWDLVGNKHCSCSANTASNLNLYRVRKRIVASDKINLRFPQSRDEMRVASEAIRLGNDQDCFLPLIGSKGSLELRATLDRVLALPGLDFTELAHELLHH